MTHGLEREQDHIFLSYASVDRARALAVADALEAEGVRVWIDRRGIAGGTVWIEEIARAVRECPILLVLCSAASVVSRNVRQELQLAWDQDKPILPLLLEPVNFPDGVSYVLHGRQWIDLSNREPAEWIFEVQRAIAGLGVMPAEGGATPIKPTLGIGPAPKRSTNLPVPPTRLLGRAEEIAAVRRAFLEEGARLVTLTGPGGTGKTRLAIEVGAELASHFDNNVYLVDLASVRERALVLSRIAQTVGVQDLEGQPLRESLRLRFAGEPSLLLLDNFEQLLESAPLLAELLADSPDLRMLITSRALLRLRAEHEISVPPLASADSNALFVERADAAKPGFMLTAENAEAVSEICRRLDGLPLAIELAAARVKLLSPQALLMRLERRLPLLTGGARDLPARQQTLSNAIAWSHDLLTPGEQLLFRQLAVFVGGWTLEAAESMCSLQPGTGYDLLDALASLVDKSLILQLEGLDGETRFGMLETIREFAEEQLAVSGEEPTVRQRHADYYVAIVETTGALLFAGTRTRDRLAAEHANVQAALRWLVHHG